MALPRFGIFIFRNQDAYLGNLSLDLRVLFSNRHENASTTEHLFTERMKKHVWMLEMKGLRRMLRVSWTAKKTNEWVLNKAGVKRELLDTVKAR